MNWRDILTKARAGERLAAEEGEALYEAELLELGQAADAVRQRLHPGNQVTFIIDRNVTFTNICVAGCEFCAFYRRADDPRAFLLTVEEVVQKVEELVRMGGTQVMLQGGLHPDLDLAFYERLCREIKARCPVHIHSFSAAEIDHLARKENLSVREVIRRLHEAGLDSLPGAAEILVDRVRAVVSPHKIRTARWLEIMRAAHAEGLHTTATMTFGLTETRRERIEHMLVVRQLQDETGGVKGFIPWTFSPAQTRLSEVPMAGGIEYLRTLAISRLMLDNIPHVHAGWVTEGPKVAQVGLLFGADDLGGVLMEEVVVKATGVEYQLDVPAALRLIRGAGKVPAQRNSRYEVLRVFDQ